MQLLLICTDPEAGATKLEDSVSSDIQHLLN